MRHFLELQCCPESLVPPIGVPRSTNQRALIASADELFGDRLQWLSHRDDRAMGKPAVADNGNPNRRPSLPSRAVGNADQKPLSEFLMQRGARAPLLFPVAVSSRPGDTLQHLFFAHHPSANDVSEALRARVGTNVQIIQGGRTILMEVKIQIDDPSSSSCRTQYSSSFADLGIRFCIRFPLAQSSPML